MKDWYLFRLFRHSRMGFLVISVFILCYGYCLTRNMDMMLFPYNAMFAFEKSAPDSIITYRIRVNQEEINYTHFPYWKKDILETSPRVFAHYIQSGRMLYIDRFILDKWGKGPMASWLSSRLSAEPVDLAAQMAWYARFAGKRVTPGTILSLWAVRLQKQEGGGLEVSGYTEILNLKLTR